MLRFGKATTQSLRALVRLLNLKSGNELAVYVIWCVSGRERKAVRQFQRQLLSELEREARAEATEIVRSEARNMALSGKSTSAESQRLLIAQLAAETLEEKLLSTQERK